MKRKDILVIIVPMLIFVIIWISFSVYHSYVNSTIKEAVSAHIDPISPSFDTKTIEKIKNREVIIVSTEDAPKSSNNSSSSSLLNVASPTPTVTETENQASSGGSLSP